MWTYTILILLKAVDRLKSKTRQCFANSEVWIFFQTGGTITQAPNKTSSASRPSSSTDMTSFSFSYSSAATIFCFKFFYCILINWSWNQAKSASYCLLSTPMHATMKDGGFSSHNCNDWWSYEQLTNHEKPQRYHWLQYWRNNSLLSSSNTTWK